MIILIPISFLWVLVNILTKKTYLSKKSTKAIMYIAFTNTLISSIYFLFLILSSAQSILYSLLTNSDLFYLGFILFVFYFVIYIKDAFVDDLIDIYFLEETKKFTSHLLEHLLEPIFILFIFILVDMLFHNYITKDVYIGISIILLVDILYTMKSFHSKKALD